MAATPMSTLQDRFIRAYKFNEMKEKIHPVFRTVRVRLCVSVRECNNNNVCDSNNNDNNKRTRKQSEIWNNNNKKGTQYQFETVIQQFLEISERRRQILVFIYTYNIQTNIYVPHAYIQCRKKQQQLKSCCARNFYVYHHCVCVREVCVCVCLPIDVLVVVSANGVCVWEKNKVT